jgi:hypothetical protein
MSLLDRRRDFIELEKQENQGIVTVPIQVTFCPKSGPNDEDVWVAEPMPVKIRAASRAAAIHNLVYSCRDAVGQTLAR